MTAIERIEHERDHGSLTARTVHMAANDDSRTLLLPPAEWEQAEGDEGERLYWADAVFIMCAISLAICLGLWALVELLT